MSSKYGYIGYGPDTSPVIVAKQVFSPTGVQTNFTFAAGYQIGYLDVYVNGARQIEGQDFSATDTSTVGLTTSAESGDVLELVAYKAYNLTIPNAPGNFSVGGNLDVTGIINATTFSGNASSATYANSAGIASTATAAATAYGLTGSPNITVGTVTGNLTGTASTATAAGTAYGLTGSPNITVGNITGTTATFTNLTVNGTQTIINTQILDVSDKNIGIGSTSTPSDALADGAGLTIYGTTNKTLTYNDTKKALETNIVWAPNETRVITGAEKVYRTSGNTVNLAYNSLSANVGYTTNPSGEVTLNVTGIPTSSDFDDYSITFAVIINSTGTARTCTAINLNGVSRTIRWAGGSLASATSGVTTTTGHAIYNFTGINTVGSASTTENYQVFGIVSGGFF